MSRDSTSSSLSSSSSAPSSSPPVPDGAVVLDGDALDGVPQFSLFNSPYPAHDRGCALDLYPGTDAARSPVAGEVLDTRTVRCPPKPYAVERDHLVVVEVDADRSPLRVPEGVATPLVARVLHVDPSVAAGDRIAPGDVLGDLVRSGFFGQWVDNHLHLGFRPADRDPYRASGSLPVAVDVPVAGVPWDGRGTVVETGPTHVLLDAPGHPAPGREFAALAADDGTPLDGGLVHYAGGGLLADRRDSAASNGSADAPLSLLGCRVGTADSRHVTWEDVAVLADGERATGLSLFAAREGFGAKVVFHEGHGIAVDDEVRVRLRPTDDPVRLG